MWPNQVNYGYGQQPQMYPVFPSQNQSQQGHIQQIVPQMKDSDIFLGKPIAVSQHYPYVGIPQVQMHTDVGTTVSQICHPVAENANNSATMKTSTKMKEERNVIKEVISPSTMRTTDNDTRAATAGKGEPFTIGEFTPEPENTAVEMWETGSGMKTTKADSWNCTTGMWNSAFGMGTGMIGMLDSAGMGDTTTRMGNTEMWNTSTAMWNTTTTGFEATTGAMGDIPSSSLNSISSSKSTKFQTVLTLQWLIENYETCEGYSVPRCVVYDQYTEFCSSNNFEPINPATFGKLIRQIFINLKTRRLGIRGQSKYHYYGIRVKPTSSLSHSKEHFTPEPKMSKRWTVPSKVEVIIKPKVQLENPNQSEAIHAATISSPLDLAAVDRGLSPVTALGLALLPQFPKAYMLKSLPFNANIHQVDVFLTEYRTHCELLLEAILKGKFSEIYSIIMSFWQDLSVSNLQLLQMPSLAGTIYFCDILLYKTIIGILIPGITQEVPQSLLKAVRIFAKDFRSKLSKYIQKLPKKVFEAKNQAATSFVKLLVRKSSLSHIAQATRSILDNSRAVKMMQADWKEKTDLENLRRQIDWLIVDVKIVEDRPKLSTYFQEFEGLLEQKATVEQHVDWINEVMKAFVDKTSETEEKSMQNFLLYVSSISELVLRDHTLRSASSFGSYHLLHMLYNEYLLYRIEATSMANAEQQLMNCQIEEEYSARYSVPQLEKAVSVVYSELNSAGAQPVATDFEYISPNTSGLCIVEDVDETDVTTRSSSKASTQCCTSKLKNKEEESSSSLIHFKTSQLPTAISEETIQDPNDISRETSVKALESSSLTGCDFHDLSPHPQKVVIAGKTALVPPEMMSKTPSYVAAKVIKMEPKSEKGYNTMAGQARQICKVNISPADANNLFKGQRINAEDGVQFIVNEVHKLPRGKSATGLGLPSTNKLSYKKRINAEDGVQFIVNEVHKLPRGKSATGLGLPSTNKLSYKKVYKSL
ncbi:uncharacterized protein [Antedon mediterranea]|uniref:uncharacterized protein n=1 Tax=Antedon mediterranea TaxID=105859 RepID=UPI003AF7CF11